MRPRILLLDEPHPKARAIMDEVGECYNLPSELLQSVAAATLDNESDIENGREEMPKHNFTQAEVKEAVKFVTTHFEIIYTGLTSPNEWIITSPKLIACPCTGIDHINTEYCKKKGVKIIHLDAEWKANEGREVTSTAEHTWSLILQLAKMKRIQLKGKTIGIIGEGRIGMMVMKYANAFDMALATYDVDDTSGGEWPYLYPREIIYINEKSYAKFGTVKACSTLGELLQTSDIITLHIPLQGNEGFIGEKEFVMMKDGALLINTSRQGVVDTDALYKALESDKIGGYADDFVNEVNFSNVFQDKVIQTPHIGGSSKEAREATDIYVSKKIVEYIKNTM